MDKKNNCNTFVKTILQINNTDKQIFSNKINTLANLDLLYFEQLKAEIQAEYLKNNSPSEEDISKWKGIDIIYFQEDLRKKAKGNISEKTFYTYFKTSNIDKLPRIDMLNLLSIYAGYESWFDFKKQHSFEDKEITNNTTENFEQKTILQKNNIVNQEHKEKNNYKLFKNTKTYIWVITSIILGILIVFLVFSDQIFKKTYQFCFTDADRGTNIQSTIDIRVIKDNESPILYKVKPGECFVFNTKDKTLKMEISAPLYEKIEISRNLENASEIETISLKPDDYALMLHYYSTKDTDNTSLEYIKMRQQKLNNLISDSALIYQVFDNEIYGVETLTKQKYIGLVTTPTKSLQNLKVIATKIKNGKIVSIKFKIENNEKK